MRRPAATAGKLLTTAGVLWIAVNAAVLQDQPHPAPFFAPPLRDPAKPSASVQIATIDPMAAAIDGLSVPQAPIAPAPARAPAGSSLVMDIQQQLTRLGYFHGPIDGRLDSTTQQAIRVFQATHGIPADGKPGLALLASVHAGAPVTKTVVEQVQHALDAQHYGPLAVDGVMGQKTAAALARFAHDHRLPETGTITPGVLDKLGVLSKLLG